LSYFGIEGEESSGEERSSERPDRSEAGCQARVRPPVWSELWGCDRRRQERGIHALTHEEKVDAGRKSGLIRGPLSYRLRIGCHALPPDVLREHCRRIAPLEGKAGGLASVVVQGMVAYTPATPGRVAEIEFAIRLATDPRYLGPVRANFRRIAEKVNEAFHAGNLRYTVRNPFGICAAIRRYRRQDAGPAAG
jgi:hypothetical protein